MRKERDQSRHTNQNRYDYNRQGVHVADIIITPDLPLFSTGYIPHIWILACGEKETVSAQLFFLLSDHYQR